MPAYLNMYVDMNIDETRPHEYFCDCKSDARPSSGNHGNLTPGKLM